MNTDTKTIRRIQTRELNFKDGYQHALADILTALEDGGEEAVREWISNNYDDPNRLYDFSNRK